MEIPALSPRRELGAAGRRGALLLGLLGLPGLPAVAQDVVVVAMRLGCGSSPLGFQRSRAGLRPISARGRRGVTGWGGAIRLTPLELDAWTEHTRKATPTTVGVGSRRRSTREVMGPGVRAARESADGYRADDHPMGQGVPWARAASAGQTVAVSTSNLIRNPQARLITTTNVPDAELSWDHAGALCRRLLGYMRPGCRPAQARRCVARFRPRRRSWSRMVSLPGAGGLIAIGRPSPLLERVCCEARVLLMVTALTC